MKINVLCRDGKQVTLDVVTMLAETPGGSFEIRQSYKGLLRVRGLGQNTPLLIGPVSTEIICNYSAYLMRPPPVAEMLANFHFAPYVSAQDVAIQILSSHFCLHIAFSAE